MGSNSSSWASRSPYQSTPTLSTHSQLLTYCSVFSLFAILIFSQDRSKAPKSTNFSTPTGLVEFAEVANRMQETGFMEKVEEGGEKSWA